MDNTEITLPAILLVLSAVLVILKIYAKRARQHPPPPPGPFALPIIGHLHLLGPRLHQTFDALSQRYGPVIQLRLGSMPCVVVSTAELAREFLKNNELVFPERMQTTAIDIVSYGSSFSFSPYGPYWKYIKKLCTYELLGSRNITQFEPIRRLEVKEFLRHVMGKAETGEAVNVTEELLKLTSNMISHTMLGIRWSEAEGGAATNVIRDVTGIFGEFDVSDIIWFCKSFDLQGARKRAVDIKQRYDSLLERIITDREKKRGLGERGDVKDILDILLDALESDNSDVKLTREHVKALIQDFFTAGTDTTAIEVEWAIAELLRNPNVLHKAQQELDNVVGSQRLLRESDAPQLPYLMAIIKETFRLHPPVPIVSRKSVSDSVIHGYKIRAQTVLFVNIWSIGRNPKYWERPMEFRPERFLDTGEASSVDVKGQNFELLPFGSGRRGCPGMLLALQELILILGNMLQCFDWKLPDGTQDVDMTERPGLAVPRAVDLVCRAVPRIDPTIISSV